MKTLAAGLAALAVRRPAVLVAAALFVVASAGMILRTQETFDTDILNLLPAGTPAVEGLRIYNARFTTARELAFLLDTRSGDFSETFIAELRKQPWAVRALEAPPLETPEGIASLPDLAAPLLLSDPAFAEKTLPLLDARRVGERITRLANATRAGSPMARIELSTDPLGILSPLAASFADRVDPGGTFDMRNDSARIVPVITNQENLSAPACRALMTDVNAFVADFVRREGLPQDAIGVTGRSAYVAEISSSMQRDIFLTSLVSLATVTVLFWVSFRSVLPLAGSVLILAFTCLVSLAAGNLVLDKLNVVAMGFCSILVGLGDDFSLLLFQHYALARRSGRTREQAIADSTLRAAPGIFWVALTTALGFATLVFSGSTGFAQLGILVAIGVLCGAVAMIVFMPLFERHLPDAPARDGFDILCGRLLSGASLTAGCVVLGTAALVAVSPWRPPSFDTSPRSLEPANIPAAQTLARMMAIFPDTFEPAMVVLPAPVSRDDLIRLDTALDQLKADGLLAGFSSPSPLREDPLLHSLAPAAGVISSQEIDRLETDNGLRPGALDPARRLLEGLSEGSPRSLSLAALSPWWFVVDRMVSPDGDMIAYLRLAEASPENRRAVRDTLMAVLPGAFVTGWSQMLGDLVPWAVRELTLFGSAVVVMVLLVLLVTYRSLAAVLRHALCLVLALAGTLATLKLTNHPVNLLSVLAFPLLLAVGVDYGVHLTLAAREGGLAALRIVMKPLLVSGLTTMAGFGALGLASNPALSGFGFVCATGVGWNLFAAACLLAPWLSRQSHGDTEESE